MKIGVFVFIGNNGWLIFIYVLQYMLIFELNKVIVQKVEYYYFDFVFFMIKLCGFGGKIEFWDYNLEFFILMVGLVVVILKIQIYVIVVILMLLLVIVVWMVFIIDFIFGGWFGVNLVIGW